MNHVDFVKPCQKLHRRLSMLWMTMQVDCEIGEVNEEGLRGVHAKRDMQLHQVAVKLPKVTAITLKEWNRTSEVRRGLNLPQGTGCSPVARLEPRPSLSGALTESAVECYTCTPA